MATYYSAGTMNWVWDYRRARAQVPECPECVGAVALLRAGDLGRKIWLQPPGGELAGPFLVVDCAHREDVEPLLYRSWVVDVSYDVGKLWGMAGPLDDVIVWADPAEAAQPAPAAPLAAYIDPKDVVITVPTQGWPTRLPAGLTGVISPPAPGTQAPMSGPPVITTPTPPGGASSWSAATLPPATAAPAGATPIPAPASGDGDIAMGRPGLDLLKATPGPGIVTNGTARVGRPTAAGAQRPTSPPILPRLGPRAPSARQQGEPGFFARVWQAFLRWIGR